MPSALQQLGGGGGGKEGRGRQLHHQLLLCQAFVCPPPVSFKPEQRIEDAKSIELFYSLSLFN